MACPADLWWDALLILLWFAPNRIASILSRHWDDVKGQPNRLELLRLRDNSGSLFFGVSITLDTYSHVLPSMQDDAVEKFNKLFG